MIILNLVNSSYRAFIDKFIFNYLIFFEQKLQ